MYFYRCRLLHNADFTQRLDVIFALDGSKNVAGRSFGKMKRFVKGVIGALNIAANRTRVGLMTYGARAFSNLQLSDGIYKSLVEQEIFSAKSPGGERNIKKAINFANTNMFNEQHSNGFGKVLVLIAAGSGSEGIVDNVTKTAIEELKKKNVTILVTAIGKDSRAGELKDFAGSGKVISVPMIDGLKSAFTEVVEESQKASGKIVKHC